MRKWDHNKRHVGPECEEAALWLVGGGAARGSGGVAREPGVYVNER